MNNSDAPSPGPSDDTELVRCLLGLHGFEYREYHYRNPEWSRTEIARDGSEVKRVLVEQGENPVRWSHEVRTTFKGSLMYVHNIPTNHLMTASDIKDWLEGFHD